MASPENAANGNGMLNGHGVGIALVAIFVGTALVVAFAASDGAIFGMNFTSPAGDSAPVINSDTGGAGAISGDAFDEEPSEEGSTPPPQQDTGSRVASRPPERGPTLSEEERRLLAMSEFSWDSIAVEYVAASQDIIKKFDQQNFTRQKPAEPGAEPLFLSDSISVDVDRYRDVRGEIIDIETPVDTPPVNNDDEEQEEEEQEEENEEADDEEPPEEDDQSGETDEDDSGSGSNSTGTNSTDTQSEDLGSENNDTSSDDSGTGTSTSTG